MTLPKKRGVRFEYRTSHKFEEFGYSWDRSGSSLGVDIKILKGGELRYLVSCKKTSESETIYLPKFEVEGLAEEASKRDVEGLICYGFYRTPIFVHSIDDIDQLEQTEKSYKLEPRSSPSLGDFLEETERFRKKS